jgi:hypothetical protein
VPPFSIITPLAAGAGYTVSCAMPLTDAKTARLKSMFFMVDFFVLEFESLNVP